MQGRRPADVGTFDPRQVDARVVRPCVLGAGAAMIATGLPWQVLPWQGGCYLVFHAYGPPLLGPWAGNALALAALAILLCSAMPRDQGSRPAASGARAAVIAGGAAMLWAVPLPLGPERPRDISGRVDRSGCYRAGAVGVCAAAIGAIWWSRALARISLDRALRRAFGRRRRRRVVTSARCAP